MRKKENTQFVCENCSSLIQPLTNGSFRNHCPYCLYSKHLDNIPGDRKSNCQGMMEPIDLFYTGKKGYQIIHKCKKCGKVGRNRIAVDTVQEDDFNVFIELKHSTARNVVL